MEDSAISSLEDPDQDCAQERTYVEESEELAALVSCIATSDEAGICLLLRRLKQILEKYQEQAHLLDPYLPSLVTDLARVLRKLALAQTPDVTHVLRISQALWAAATVRGSKAISKFFPNEASDLEPVVDLLSHLDCSQWEAQCVLLLWLSQLVLIPFDLAIVDSSQARPGTDERARELEASFSLTHRIISACKEHLRNPGSARDMAARVLGRLLTRRDTATHLADYLDWATAALLCDEASATFLIPGVAQSLALAFASGQRAQLLPVAERLWPAVSQLFGSTTAQSSVLIRKLAVKLIQRVGLVFLAPRMASWRYKMEYASLHVTLGGQQDVTAQPGSGAPLDDLTEQPDDDIDVPEVVEEILGLLLEALGDRDTVVRWSAAKGLGRMTNRLPQELGDQVVVSVLELLCSTAGDTAWHGGCLALAELARRGLLLPVRLHEAVPHIAQALLYDVRRGAHSVGAHVRDAAAYVCWAIARAYAPDILENPMAVLAPVLLTAVCYDREVNCRRAASAAFQESVGRQGNIPHGITILNAADYFCVATRTQAYLLVAPSIAVFPEYRHSLADHLLDVKLAHWDRAVRALAARALAALVPCDPPAFAGEPLKLLACRCLDPVLEVRHGAAMGLAELVLALHHVGYNVDPEQEKLVAGIVTAVEKARLYRGKGGELMRGGICRLIECCSLARLPLTTAQRSKAHETLDENLRHPNGDIRNAAASALQAFAATYCRDWCSVAAERYTLKYMGGLHDQNVALRRGYAMALGAMPAWLLQPHAADVIAALVQATKVEDDPEDRDAEARAEAVKALCAVAKALVTRSGPDPEAASILHRSIIPALLDTMADYSTDNRGDVGSWVREAAMAALVQLLSMLPDLAPGNPANSSAATAVVASLAKQAVERIGRLRESAAAHLCQLLRVPEERLHLPAREALSAALSSHASACALPEAPQLAPLVREPELCEAVLEGLMASIGGLDGSLARASGAALTSLLLEGDDPLLQEEVANKLMGIWRRNQRSARLAVPILRTVDLLLSQGALARLEPSTHLFAGQVVELAREEARNCKDVPRLCAVATMTCHFVTAAPQAGRTALQLMLSLLGNRYPKVRKHAAQQLYVRLLPLDTLDCSTAEETDVFRDALSCTAWDGPLDIVLEARAALYSALHLEAPTVKGKGSGKVVTLAARAGDENESYGALIADAAR